ncbi:MAG: 50S ribosomal protein L21 [Candidatus Brennerbacteria bacterium CG23_combo_of_CG06-09_8_20_14_all_44_41]|uniref:Large ribosomal subunit protein bL21 n=2 Tax=Candidatus Brenneribacteriota TaxID=1817902 RepID=A0A2M8C3C9_9BACT|nr:MAG: 50S ribosomal protein L21 [Parcubacteria group bacterium CG1_02_44_31]PIP50416.1 MAG: 50S ribosomal protein L21 [Candidatus Brennerbacteria bacterium CG23_combo_of_CG06-09_8_20_14_all_44_41]PIX29052.1 MAG: 50S ribosomal protein L21 [Candidatus Brennerbacteria bacterium CG_4_8_14_3_um_filter_43_14]PJA18929.1 MAG: 50S ribosomal protein L21 [Candidatus Brennerbacteria bacterium CG_4_10_14_0_2_um_filter_43_14]PJB50605.1 MAG: 50S ribosomal protein L21 [Candidatus Brennerbacteria bacterium CG
MQAIVKIKGHQYLVVPKMKFRVDRMIEEEGAIVSFPEVYAIIDNDTMRVGKPIVAGASVQATVLKHARGKKVITFKYRPKARSRVKKGFKPEYTEIEITEIQI